MNANKKKNKFLSLLLAMIMVLTMVPATAFAATDSETTVPVSHSRFPDITGIKVTGAEVKAHAMPKSDFAGTQDINIYVSDADKNNSVNVSLEVKEGSAYRLASGGNITDTWTLQLVDGTAQKDIRVQAGASFLSPMTWVYIKFSVACTNPEGDAHTYDSGKVTTEPTCITEGTKIFTCTCGATKTEPIATVSHTWDEGEVTTEPTCTEKGDKVKKCTTEGCEATTTEKIAALGHDWNDGKETKAATCGKDGIKTFVCKRDGCKEVKTTDIPATGEHKWDAGKVTTKPTCIDGVKTFTCSSCKTTKTEAVPATKEHNWNEGEQVKAPTYYANGNTKYTCKVCDEEKTEADIPMIEDPVFVDCAYYLDDEGNQVAVEYEVTDFILNNYNKDYDAPLHTFKVPEDVETVYIDTNSDIFGATHWFQVFLMNEDGTNGSTAEQIHGSVSGDIVAIPMAEVNGLEKYLAANDARNNYAYCVAYKFEAIHIWDEGKVTKPATATEDGEFTYTCTFCEDTKTETIAKIESAKLSATSYTYNGKVKAPAVTVKDSEGNVLTKGEDYTVTYDKGRKSVGQYKVKVTYTGKYSGTKTLTFKIVPAATKVTSLKAEKKAMTVKWSKKTTQTTGYQIKYATNKNFDNAKYKLVKSNKTTKAKISKLTSKKTYYVAVRTYKNVKVDGKTVKIYSSWSKAKSVKVK